MADPTGPGDGLPKDEAERRLAAAMARSPELAAMMSPGPPRRPGPRRWMLVLAALGAAVVILPILFGVCTRPEQQEPARDVAPPGASPPKGSVLPRLEGRIDPSSGHEVAPFEGFAVSVETDPPGALVTVDGRDRGESPVLADLACTPGAPVEIRAAHGGRTARTTVGCRSDALVKITLRLGR